MIWSFVAIGAVAALSVKGPGVLRHATSNHDPGPRVELTLWVGASVVWLLSCIALVLVAAAELLGPSLKGIVATCVSLYQAVESHGSGAMVAVGAALLLGLFAAGRLVWTGLLRGRAGRSWRRGHARELDEGAVPRVLHGHQVWLVPSPRPEAYCVPGNGGRIVITSGALEVLTPRQAHAVLEHERAHLDGGHHLLVGWVRLLDKAFPRVPLLRAAAERVPVLVEWAADDRAVRRVGVGPLAHALGRFAGSDGASDTVALSIGGACPVERVRRHLTPAPRCSRTPALGRAVSAGLVLVAPLAFTIAMTMTSAIVPPCYCPV
mgnify:CR=1 FL=1